MDFYIKTYVTEALGKGTGMSYPVERSFEIDRQSSSDTTGTFRMSQFNFDIYPKVTRCWSLSNNANLAYYPSYSVVQTYHAVDSSDYISEYRYAPELFPNQITYLKAGGQFGYDRRVWAAAGWNTEVQSTFEEQLCNFFYSITQQQPSNIGTLGSVPDTMNLYLYRCNLTDSNSYIDIPIFMRGNNPVCDRVYTASLIP